MAGVYITESNYVSTNSGRKRKWNPAKWKDTEAIIKRQSGQPYEGRTGNVNERYPPDVVKVCTSRCKYEGCLIGQEKLPLFNSFWEHHPQNHDRQTDILARLMNYEDAPENSRFAATWEYYLKTPNGKRIRCCLKTFQDTFGINKGRIEYVQKLIKTRGLNLMDMRGKQSNPNHKMSDMERSLVLQHINSFPKHISHYSRNVGNPEALYLSSKLSMKIMYRLYEEYMGGRLGRTLSVTAYRNIFNTTGIKIGLPRTDSCNTCDKYYVQLCDINPEDQVGIQNLEVEIERHHVSADQAYSSLREDTNTCRQSNGQSIIFCVDLQVQLSPRLSCSENFYKRKFSSCNLAITNPVEDNSIMYTWNQTDGRRGQTEIGSIIYKHVHEEFTPLVGGQPRTLVVYSDRCAGQNNNYQNICVYKLLIHEGYFTSITQKFLVTGHSFLPCDRHFAHIDRLAKRRFIYIPQDWIDIMMHARIQNPFRVKQVVREDFKDFSSLKDAMPPPETFRVSQYLQIRISATEADSIYTKADYNAGTAWVRHFLLGRRIGRGRNVQRNPWNPEVLALALFRNAYPERLEVPADKAADIRALVGFLPRVKREAWNEYLPAIPDAAVIARDNANIIHDHDYFH